MSDIDSSAVTANRSWTDGGLAQKDRHCIAATVVLTGQGTTTNKIPATAFGLSVIEEVSPFIASDDGTGYFATPSYDGTNILLFEDASDAPADETGTFKTVVKGY